MLQQSHSHFHTCTKSAQARALAMLVLSSPFLSANSTYQSYLHSAPSSAQVTPISSMLYPLHEMRRLNNHYVAVGVGHSLPIRFTVPDNKYIYTTHHCYNKQLYSINCLVAIPDYINLPNCLLFFHSPPLLSHFFLILSRSSSIPFKSLPPLQGVRVQRPDGQASIRNHTLVNKHLDI